MRKKSKEKKNLKWSLLLLLLFAILLTASTYAWFTANKIVTISSLNVQVEAQNGLQISTDAVEWKAVISKDDITAGYVGHKNQLPELMEPVSTVGEDDGAGRLRMFYGTVTPNETDGENELTATEEDEELAGNNGKYIAFDLFFKADTAMDINLTGESSVISETYADKGLQNATRVAFLVLGHGESDTPPATIQAWNTREDLAIWEPNAGSHTSVAAASANSTYYGGSTIVQAGATDQAPITYYGVKAEISAENAQKLSTVNTGTPNSTYFQQVTGIHSTNEVMTPVEGILSLQQGITKVRVYMWVEGQDVDCDNSASGSDITFKIQLEAPEQSAP